MRWHEMRHEVGMRHDGVYVRSSLDSHDVLHRSGLDEHSDGMKLRQLQPLDGVARHVQDTVFTLKTTTTLIEPVHWSKSHEQKRGSVASYLLGHLSDRLHAGSIQVAVVLSCLDEPVVLDVFLHLLSGYHEVIVPAVHLVVPLRPGRI